MAHACTTELQPAIAQAMPSIAQTILTKVRCGKASTYLSCSVSALRWYRKNCWLAPDTWTKRLCS
jgi:hypothetical protein